MTCDIRHPASLLHFQWEAGRKNGQWSEPWWCNRYSLLQWPLDQSVPSLECRDSYMPTWSQTGQKRLAGGSFVTPVKASRSLSLPPFSGSFCWMYSAPFPSCLKGSIQSAPDWASWMNFYAGYLWNVNKLIRCWHIHWLCYFTVGLWKQSHLDSFNHRPFSRNCFHCVTETIKHVVSRKQNKNKNIILPAEIQPSLHLPTPQCSVRVLWCDPGRGTNGSFCFPPPEGRFST